MKYRRQPGIEYQAIAQYRTRSLGRFVRMLDAIPDETPLAWFSQKWKEACDGVWLRTGTYRVKHGSFVEPCSLAVYGAEYFEADAGGRHECIQLGRGPAPDDARKLETAKDLKEILGTLIPEEEESGKGGSDTAGAAEGPSDDVGRDGASRQPSEAGVSQPSSPRKQGDGPFAIDGRLASSCGGGLRGGLSFGGEEDEDVPAFQPKLLEPDEAFEFHGKLTVGWHMALWRGDGEEGPLLLVFD